MASQKVCDDILEEIFVRLPIEEIYRIKCVSKKWNLITCTARFRSLYASRQRGNHANDLRALLGFFVGYSSFLGRNNMSSICFVPTCSASMSIRTRKFVNEVGHCTAISNGVILCGSGRNTYYVCNPIKDRWFKLPPPIRNADHAYVAVALSYEESVKDDGYMHPSFTVIRSERGCYHTNQMRIETYSSDTGVWKEARLETADYIFMDSLEACGAVGSIFYWIAKALNGGQEHWVLVAYDCKARDDKAWVIKGNFLESACGLMAVALTESSEGNLQYAVNFCHNISIYRLRKKLREYSYRSVVPSPESVHIRRLNKVASSYGLCPQPAVVAFHTENSRVLMVRDGETIYWYEMESEKSRSIQRLPFKLGDWAVVLPFYWPEWPPVL